MTINFKKENDKWVMFFKGRLDTSATSTVEHEMKVFDNCNGDDIILDCEGLEYISSSGLRLFLVLLKKHKTRGSHIYLRKMNNNLKKVFDMTGFTSLFEFV